MTATGGSFVGWLRADPRRTDVVVATVTALVAASLIVGSPEEFDTGWPEVAAGVGAFVLVLLRRRWPLLLLAVSIVWSAIHTVVWDRPSSMLFATLVLLVTACIRLERREAIALGVVVGAVLYVFAHAVNDDLAAGDGRALIAPVWTAAAVGVADAVRSWRRYRESADAQLQAAVSEADARARQQVAEERLVIARELHDLLAHSLSVMNVQTGAALHLLRSDPDRSEEALVAARDAGRSVLDELRDLLAVLRDDGAEHEQPRASLPQIDDVGSLVETMRAAGLSVTWSTSGKPRELAPAVSLAAYRIIQEALTNAAKHGAGSATLTTGWDGEALLVTIENPVLGGGPDSPARSDVRSGGHGLIGMRERAAANGGSLEAGPTSSGFAVRARLPVAHLADEVTS